MTTGAGTAAQIGWAIETVSKTRQTPTKFAPFVSETLKTEQAFIRSKGLAAGRRYGRAKAPGTKNVSGGIVMEMQAETIGTLLRAALGGAIVDAGAGPYTHTIAGGVLPTLTIQVLRPFAGLTTLQAFDYTGVTVNQWTISANPNEYAMLSLDTFAYDELTNQTAATYTPAATITPLTFQNVTIATPDGTVCFDSFTLTGNNAVEQSFKSCATDLGRAVIREAGTRVVSGTLNGDFAALTAYSRYLAGTVGTLTLTLESSAAAKLVITMSVFYTGSTPNVGGPGVVQQGVPFEVIHATSDATAITAVLTNSDATG